jgi:hypothetical protein
VAVFAAPDVAPDVALDAAPDIALDAAPDVALDAAGRDAEAVDSNEPADSAVAAPGVLETPPAV